MLRGVCLPSAASPAVSVFLYLLSLSLPLCSLTRLCMLLFPESLFFVTLFLFDLLLYLSFLAQNIYPFIMCLSSPYCIIFPRLLLLSLSFCFLLMVFLSFSHFSLTPLPSSYYYVYFLFIFFSASTHVLNKFSNLRSSDCLFIVPPSPFHYSFSRFSVFLFSYSLLSHTPAILYHCSYPICLSFLSFLHILVILFPCHSDCCMEPLPFQLRCTVPSPFSRPVY